MPPGASPDHHPADVLPLTGERTVPGVARENYWFRRHEAAYRTVARLLPGHGLVADLGIGEGYGADLLTTPHRRLVGLDYDPATLRHVRRRYPRLPVVRGNAVALPFHDHSLHAVVSSQLIEHLWEQPRHVAECARVLHPGGLLILTTPNRYTFSPGYEPARDTPRNLYHTREFSPAELADLVARFLPVRTVLGVRAGARLRELDAQATHRYGADLVETQLAQATDDWPEDLLRLVALVRAEDFEISDTDPDTALDLMLVAEAP